MQTQSQQQHSFLELAAIIAVALSMVTLLASFLFWEQILRLVILLIDMAVLVGQFSAIILLVLLAFGGYSLVKAFNLWLKGIELGHKERTLSLEMAQAEVLSKQTVLVTVKAGETAFSNRMLHQYTGQPVGKNRQIEDKVVEGAVLRSMLAQEADPLSLAEPQLVSLPTKIDLLDLLPQGSSVNNLVLGVWVDEKANQLKTVSIGLENFVHGAIGGSSGFGKSVLGRALAYQLFTAPEQVEIGLIDLEGVTFSVFSQAPKLRYPLCDTVDRAVQIAQDLQGELKRRKKLYQQYPTVEKLSEYNAIADRPLAPIVLMVDESTTLFHLSKEFETELTNADVRIVKA